MSWNELLNMGNYPEEKSIEVKGDLSLNFTVENKLNPNLSKFEKKLKNLNIFDWLFRYCKNYIDTRIEYKDVGLSEDRFGYYLKVTFKHKNQDCGYGITLDSPYRYLNSELYPYITYIKHELENLLNQIKIFKEANK